MREKILIVDDIELNREMLAVALGDTFPVIEAGDGDKAIEELHEKQKKEAIALGVVGGVIGTVIILCKYFW